MQARAATFLAVGSLALALGGCVVSERQLFDPAAAVTPALAGRYEQQEFKQGRWTKNREGTLKIEGRVYYWKPDNETEPASFSLFPAGKGHFTVYARIVEPGKPEHYYALIRKNASGYRIWQPVCSDFRKVELPLRVRPKVVGSNCFYSDPKRVTAALIAYTRAKPPSYRYVPLKP
jgi:hypothetical protein